MQSRRVPFHLAICTGLWAELFEEAKKDGVDVKGSEDSARVQYSCWDAVLAVVSQNPASASLLPGAGLRLPSPPAPFLLHCFKAYSCTTAAVKPVGVSMWQVIHGKRIVEVSTADLCRFADDAVDSSLVSFHIGPARGGAPHELLSLQAGGCASRA